MSINLADNALSGVLDPESFAGLTGLRKLTLDNNSISLPENSLFNLPDLDELSLRNCGLDSLPSEMFSHLNTLKVLDMSDNPFKTVSLIISLPIKKVPLIDFSPRSWT